MDIAKTKQEWPDSGSTLEIFFVIFTKLIPRRIFFCIAKTLVFYVCNLLVDDGPLPDLSCLTLSAHTPKILGGGRFTPKFHLGGGVSEIPCFTVFSRGPPPKF